jgi:hypothetical protein
VQVGSDRTRVYASAGCFSRGAIFASGAVERAITGRVTLAGTVMYSHSLKDLSATTLSGLNPYRVDAVVGGSFNLTRQVGLYVSGGRTVSKMDQNGVRLILNAGLGVALGGKKQP